MENQIQQWLQQARQSGMTDEQIRQQLVQGGWAAGDIATALGSAQQQAVPTQPGFAATPGVEYTPKNYTIGKHIFRRAFAEARQALRLYWFFVVAAICYVLFFIFVLIPVVLTSVYAFFGFFLLSWLVLMFLAYTTTIIISNKPQSILEVCKITFRRFIPFFFSSLLAGFVIMGGEVLLIVPGILMALAFTMLPFVTARENLNGFSALKRCYILVRKFRGNIFGSQIMLFLAIIAAFVGIFLLAIIIGFIVALITSKQAGGTTGLIALITSLITLYVFLPLFQVSFMHILYEDLVAIRPMQADPEVGKRGGKLMIIYGILGVVIFVAQLISSPFTKDNLGKNVYGVDADPATRSQYIAAQRDLYCYQFENNLLFSQRFNTEQAGGTAISSTEAYQMVQNQMEIIAAQHNTTAASLNAFSFTIANDYEEYQKVAKEARDAAVAQCGYTEE